MTTNRRAGLQHGAHAARRCLVPLLAGLAFAACRPAPPPPIIWIVVDTLRADHLEWYGYGRTTSPALRPLVEHGVLFENAYTPQTQTTPAIASMFTGLYPERHGLRDLYVLLHEDNRTGAEQLVEAGYETAAFVSSFVMVHDFSNLSQGFAITTTSSPTASSIATTTSARRATPSSWRAAG